MAAFWLHVRTSPAKWVAPVLAVAMLAMLLVRDQAWVGIWPETGGAVNPPVVMLGALWAGASAWLSARADANGARALVASASRRRPLQAELNRLGAHLVWVVASYLPVPVVAAVMTATAGHWPPGISYFLWYWVVALTLLALTVPWGWLIGRCVPSIVAAPLAALSWYQATIMINRGELSGVTPLSGGAWWDADPVVLWSRTALVVVAVCGVALVPVRAWRKRFLAGCAVATAGVVLAVAVMGNTNLLEPRPLPTHPLCRTMTVQYCLWPEDGAYFSLIAPIDGRLSELPTGLPLPPRFVDYAMSGATVWRDGMAYSFAGKYDPEILFRGRSPWAVSDALARGIVQQVAPDCPFERITQTGTRLDALEAYLEARLAGGGTPDYVENPPSDLEKAYAEGRRVAGETPAQQQEWVTQQVGDVQAICRGA